MAKITWILSGGREISAEVASGTNLMNAAVNANVPGVVGECGGCLSCATCHVVIDKAWEDWTGAPDATEDAMLDIVDQRVDNSRLSCQIIVTDALDGLRLHVPQA